MDRAGHPSVYSIAAHRGFADALIAGLVPRYFDPDFGLSRLTLLLPSSRAARTVSEAFIRQCGVLGIKGLLMPRMAMVGDLDLDETLGPLLDPLGASEIPPAVDPTRRWLELAELLRQEMETDKRQMPGSAGLLRLARETAATMDRLLVEDVAPDELLSERVMDLLAGSLSEHWRGSIRLFARVQARWRARLAETGEIDSASRRNLLFDRAARRWREESPQTPIVAAGVTSAAPALARMLRVIADLPNGAVILPDLDLAMDDKAWKELGLAGHADGPGDAAFGRGDVVTHPQYHLKLLLNRMGVNRAEVMPWHRKGISAAPPERSHAISALFLPPEASKEWVSLPAEKRRLSDVRLITAPNGEAEAQAIAVLVREALETPEKRVALITPDRVLAQRVVHHLERWNIAADDSAGRPLNLTVAGRMMLQLAELVSEELAPAALIAALSHPLVRREDNRGAWLESLRAFERQLRGPRPAPGLAALREIADKAGVADWWTGVEPMLAGLTDKTDNLDLADALDLLAGTVEQLAGEFVWAQEDGRALARFVEYLRLHAREAGTRIVARDLHAVLRDAMEQVAVRPPYGEHPRVAIYGLLESRMTRADLVICGGLNEGTWPGKPGADPLLAPAILRALGVPGSDFRIGLSAHDLAGALGAPEVVLSRAQRDAEGPTIASRFLLRVQALLGEDLIERHRERSIPLLARELDTVRESRPAKRPRPRPSAEQRRVAVSVTALDRLRSDPYQFYAQAILALRELDPLDAEPSPAWQGTLAHKILEDWHKGKGRLDALAEQHLEAMNAHPLTRALWRPRLLRALEWVELKLAQNEGRNPEIVEKKGEMSVNGVTIHGKVDRIDRLPDGSMAIIDYKTGNPPSAKQVDAGYALQLGTLGLIAEACGFGTQPGIASAFEYWSLGRDDKSETGFGKIVSPVKTANNRSPIDPAKFLPETRRMLEEALDKWILGDAPFTARENPDAPVYATFDQLMRLEEWLGRDQ